MVYRVLLLCYLVYSLPLETCIDAIRYISNIYKGYKRIFNAVRYGVMVFSNVDKSCLQKMWCSRNTVRQDVPVEVIHSKWKYLLFSLTVEMKILRKLNKNENFMRYMYN